MLLSEGALAANEDIGLGGYVQLHEGDETLAHLREVLPLAPEFARVVSATEIAALTGLTPRCGGIHYLRGGWLTPAAVCHALLAHPLITLQTNCGDSPRRTAATRDQVAAAHYHSRADDTPVDTACARKAVCDSV